MTQFDTDDNPLLDDCFDVLANDYRRRLLVALLDQPTDAPVEMRIPDDVADDEDDLAALEVALVHVHLPKLEQAGFVEWDRQTDGVRRGPRFDAIEPVLKILVRHADELRNRCLNQPSTRPD